MCRQYQKDRFLCFSNIHSNVESSNKALKDFEACRNSFYQSFVNTFTEVKKIYFQICFFLLKINHRVFDIRLSSNSTFMKTKLNRDS